MDLGINHVWRKHCSPVDPTSHLLIQVPGDPDGPGGVIVVSSGMLTYKKIGHEDREVLMPRRND
jgi:splicing factor 3B subunit 3